MKRDVHTTIERQSNCGGDLIIFPQISQMKTSQFSHLLVSLPSNLWSWWWDWEREGKDLLQNSETSIAAVILSLLALLVFFWYGCRIIFRSKKDNLRLPPGPRGLPLVGNLPFLDPELHTYFNQLGQSYGPIFKLWLGNTLGVVVSSPSLAKEVLKDHDITFANRDVPIAALVVTYDGSDIAWNPYGPEWRMLRRVCVREMLCNQSLDGVYFLRRREVQQMVKHIYSKNGSPIDVGEQMFMTVLNVITSMLWGATLKGDESTTLGTEFRQVVNEITDLLGKPNLSDFFPGLARFDLQGIKKQIGRLFVRFDRIFELIIQQRLKMEAEDGKANDGEEKKDFLQFLLKLKDEEDPKTPFTMIHLKALLMDMVVGGTETTSNTVEWAVAEMMNKPETIRKAQEELERIVGKGNSVEESHISQLNYLQSVMKEVLRLHPALPLLIPHCPSSSCTVGGYMIPKGARVFINVWAIHRDPSIWDNPSEFNPERFSNCNADYTGKDFNYFPFGSGRRICAGIPMAERMFMYELATLLHLFDWGLPDGEKLNLKEKFGIVLKKEAPLIAVATPRFSDPALYDA